jgi:hypothetical protein
MVHAHPAKLAFFQRPMQTAIIAILHDHLKRLAAKIYHHLDPGPLLDRVTPTAYLATG